jgi:hypothetical protein
MSIECMNWVKNLDAKFIKASPRQILKELADFADEQNSCYPGTTLLHEVTSQSVRTVQANLRILESMGLITTIPRPNDSSRYILNRHMSFPMRKIRKRGAKSAPPYPRKEIGTEVPFRKQETSDEVAGVVARGAESAPLPHAAASSARGAESVAPGVQNLSSRGAESAPKPPGNHQRTTRRGGASARPTPLPLDWQPGEAGEAYARRLGLDPAALAVRFRKTFLASGKRQVDWAQRWELWCDEDADEKGAAAASTPAAAAPAASAARDEQGLTAGDRGWLAKWQAKVAAGEHPGQLEELLAKTLTAEGKAELQRRKATTSRPAGKAPEIFRASPPQRENFFT